MYRYRYMTYIILTEYICIYMTVALTSPSEAASSKARAYDPDATACVGAYYI